MKNFLILLLSAVVLVGCYSDSDSGNVYDNYGVKYYQSGSDCIYYINEPRKPLNDSSLKNIKGIVYPHTKCSDLYAKDNFGVLDKKITHNVKVIKSHKKPHYCRCRSCCRGMKLKHRYILK